ncbi:MAG: periplasmic heavy metal sensor [Candidatus Rokubacteria bacterium]|nr:periplasmic heavy metal sensor [Candidatus Rokubacteria bacterium]
MRIRILGAFLPLLMLASPAAGSEPRAATPAAHAELGRAIEELSSQLHGLGSRWREHFMHPGPRAERPLITLMLRHRDELGLSADQVQSLERLRADFQREAIRRDADLRVAEVELGSLLNADAVDLGQVETKLREIERIRVDLRLARIRTIEQGKAQLSPEQRAKLRSLLAEPRMPGPPMGSPRHRTGDTL